MIQINSQPVPTRTIAPSSESSDNSGHEEYYPDGGRQNHERFEQKKTNASFSGGTIPVESWQTYADLAGIMDAISEIQTKEMFTTMAKEALTRMKNCENDPEPTEYAKQSSLLLDLMSHANVLENSSTETPDHEKQSKLSKFVPDDAGEIDWIGTLEFLDEQQKRLLPSNGKSVRSQSIDSPGIVASSRFGNRNTDIAPAKARGSVDK